MRLSSRVGFGSFSALVAVGVSVVGYAQTLTVADNGIKDEIPVEAQVSGTEVAPLTSSLQPTTAWPAVVSGTLIHSYNLLSYNGVEAASRQLLGKDFDTWKSHFNMDKDLDSQGLPEGMLMVSGCRKPGCDAHKSLLVVSPLEQKVYTAMVTEGKVGMWPSLMSWPDAAIPALKEWLSKAADDKEDN